MLAWIVHCGGSIVIEIPSNQVLNFANLTDTSINWNTFRVFKLLGKVFFIQRSRLVELSAQYLMLAVKHQLLEQEWRKYFYLFLGCGVFRGYLLLLIFVDEGILV